MEDLGERDGGDARGVGTEIACDVVDRELERLLGRELTRPLQTLRTQLIAG